MDASDGEKGATRKRVSWLSRAAMLGLLAAVVALSVAVWLQRAELKRKERQIAQLELAARDQSQQIARLADEVRRLQKHVDDLRLGRDRQAAGTNGQASEAGSFGHEESSAMGFSIHERLTFFPLKYPDGDWQPRDLVFEDVWFTAADGVKVHGWHCPHEKPRAAMLLSLGNAGNLSYWVEFVRYLHDSLAVSTLIYDYRGYGRSGGAPTVSGILLDARAAREELARREGIAPRDVVLFGRSLGGAVSIDLAADGGARGLVVESSFTSLRDVGGQHYPSLLVNLLVPAALDSQTKIKEYRGSLLISHGSADRTVPYAHGQRLFAAANEPKQFVTIQGGDHNDPQSADYYRALDKFIGSLPPVEK